MRSIASLLLSNFSKNAFNGLSVLGKFVRTYVFLFLVPSMNPSVCTYAL